MKNAMQRLMEALERKLPGIAMQLDRPENPHTSWWLDLGYSGHSAVVEWRPRQGFGISAPNSPDRGYGEGPDEVYARVDETVDRVIHLMKQRASTRPPRDIILRKLRESRRISQEELARSLKVGQASISKIERRSDMYISTLRRVIEAMGGNLEIRARFPEGVVRITQFEEL